MRIAHEILRPRHWTLADSRRIAALFLESPRHIKALVPLLFSSDTALRLRSADIARRMTDRDATCLVKFGDEIIGALSELPLNEFRARWHLALVAARSAQTRVQIQRLAPMLIQMMQEHSNVLRCSAIEGLGVLAMRDPSLRPMVLDVCHAVQSGGTTAMVCRARHALKGITRAQAQK